MYSRVTLLEIDTMRIDVSDAAELFREQVLPGLQEQDFYEGAVVLATPEGRGMIVTIWDSEDAARDGSGFAAKALERYLTIFKAPPGREQYEVVVADLPGVLVA
jgi:heme-degrading monooxygenase HmoA